MDGQPSSRHTSKTFWEAVKSCMEFCKADKMARLMLSDQTGSSTDGQTCSMWPSWNENSIGCCSRAAAKWVEPATRDRADPSCGSDCSRVTRFNCSHHTRLKEWMKKPGIDRIVTLKTNSHCETTSNSAWAPMCKRDSCSDVPPILDAVSPL